jgi:DNA-binding CsgD family transcriptional regulator
MVATSAERLGGHQAQQQARLSRREREILALLAQGLRTRDIADTCCVSIKTIDKHVTNMRLKLDLTHIGQLYLYAAHTVGHVAPGVQGEESA